MNPRILQPSGLLHYMEIAFYGYFKDTNRLMHFKGITRILIKRKL